MWHIRKILVILMSIWVFSLGAQVFANEKSEHQSSSVELGVLGQLSLRHFAPSIGTYGVVVKDQFELHASAWTNVTNLGGGIGAGTLHRVGSRIWLGWEMVTEIEEHDSALFIGVGPVFEVAVVPHRFNGYVSAPFGWGRSDHYNGFEWAVVAGFSVAIWH